MRDEVQQMIRSVLISVRGNSCQHAQNFFFGNVLASIVSQFWSSPGGRRSHTMSKESKDSTPLSRLPFRVFINYADPPTHSNASIFPLVPQPNPSWLKSRFLAPPLPSARIIFELAHIPLRNSLLTYTASVFRYVDDRISMTSLKVLVANFF